MNHAKILIVDDEQAISQMLKTILLKENFHHIETAETANEALAACEKNRYDLVLLDVMLPDQSGFDICPFIRKTTDAPIFFLTARDTDLDKLSGFAMGADDYITKPFNPLEVVARVKAHLKRTFQITPSSSSQNDKFFDFGRFQVNAHSGELIVSGQSVDCPAQVFQLLLFFCEHPNQIFSKEQLYEKVWGEQALDGDDNTVMVHIRKIRERIEENPSQPKYLVTIRGLGYKLMPLRIEK